MIAILLDLKAIVTTHYLFIKLTLDFSILLVASTGTISINLSHNKLRHNRVILMKNILNKFKAKITKPSFKIAFVYFILGCLWTVLTSKIISWLPKDNPIFFVIGIQVAYFFVLITAVVLYIHSDKQIKKIEKVKDELNEKNCLISSILESSPEVKFFTIDKDYNYIATITIEILCSKSGEKKYNSVKIYST